MSGIRSLRPMLAASALLGGIPLAVGASEIDGITFALSPGEVYVPLDEAATALGWRVAHDSAREAVWMKNGAVPYGSLRRFVDGTELITLADLARAGARVRTAQNGTVARISSGFRSFTVTVGAKHAEVNLAKQQLRAWQGERLVLDSNISSGRGGSTPAGDFRAGPYKAKHHYSSRYNNAPMPWSVQINGHIFIHGFTSVPKYPASHGCIRLPLTGGNPARFFYEWIDKGVPVKVTRK